METSHSHHLEIHSTSLLSRLKPEIKIAATFVIVLSIAFLSLENNISIIVQTFVVLLFIYLFESTTEILLNFFFSTTEQITLIFIKIY